MSNQINEWTHVDIVYRGSSGYEYGSRLCEDLITFGIASTTSITTSIGEDPERWMQALGDQYKELRECRKNLVVLLIVTPDLFGRDSLGFPIYRPRDHIRFELELCISYGVRILPVLFDLARMPSQSELPNSLRGLVKLRAAIVRSDDWETCVRSISKEIHGHDVVDLLRTSAAAAASRPDGLIRRLLFKNSNPSNPDKNTSQSPICFGASAPIRGAVNTPFVARLVIYTKKTKSTALRKIKPPLPIAIQSFEDVLPNDICEWVVGTPFLISLTGQDFSIPHPDQEHKWSGSESLGQFVVTPASIGHKVLEFSVSVSGVVLTRIPFVIDVFDDYVASEETIGQQSMEASMPREMSLFASYASEDREQVRESLHALKSWNPRLDIFFDKTDLVPNEKYKNRLEHEIATRDRFLLCWSLHAKNSAWVNWETNVARLHKAPKHITLFQVPRTDFADPPDFLADRHLGSKYID
jgi:hypothetical protein